MSPYGLSKRINELYADVFGACYGFQSIGLRYFNVFGPRQDPDGPYASVIPAWIGALLRGETAYVNGADIGKVERLLGYRPGFDLGAGLTRTIEWYIAELAPVGERSIANV